MNDPEVTMSNAAPETKLVAHEKAVKAAGIAIALVIRVPAPLKSIADQVIRLASSVPANLAEGHGRTGRVRMNSPPAAIRRRRLRWKGGWGSAIGCSLAGVSHGARRAPVITGESLLPRRRKSTAI